MSLQDKRTASENHYRTQTLRKLFGQYEDRSLSPRGSLLQLTRNELITVFIEIHGSGYEVYTGSR